MARGILQAYTKLQLKNLQKSVKYYVKKLAEKSILLYNSMWCVFQRGIENNLAHRSFEMVAATS